MGVQKMPVSTLGDLLRIVTAGLNGMADGLEILVGKKYLTEFGVGSPPRVLFVPEPQGKLSGPTKLNSGYLASYTHGCTAYIRGAEDGSDIGRFDSAYAICDRIINLLKWADPGHVVLGPGNPKDNSPTNVDAYGAEIVFSFQFTRPVAEDPAVFKSPVTPISPPNPDKPQGDTGKTFLFSTSAEDPDR